MVIRGVSFEISQGNIICLLGANGAGKTTTLKAISGLLKNEEGEVSEGSITFEGIRIDKMTPEEKVALGIIHVLEERGVLEHLTTEENLRVGAYLQKDRSIVKKNLEVVYDYFPNLKVLKNRTSGYLSGGEQQMLAIGRALMANPKLVLLDEPSLGLAPLLVKEVFYIVKKISNKRNTSILLVEQNAKAALSIAYYGYVMENGRIVLDGSTEKLSENEDIKEFYMGLSQVGVRKSYRDVKHYKRRKRWLA